MDNNRIFNVTIGVICIGLGILFLSMPILGIILIATGIFAIVYHPKTKNDETTQEAPSYYATKEKSSSNNAIKSNAPTQVTAPTPKTTAGTESNVIHPDLREKRTEVRYYFVAGVRYYLDHLLKLSYHNTNYDLTKRELIDLGLVIERVWERSYFAETVRFVSEPDNPHDPNAIRVEIENEHVGYIPARECTHIAEIVSENKIVSVHCEITGGKYKCVDVDYSDTGREIYALDRGEEDYSIELRVEYLI